VSSALLGVACAPDGLGNLEEARFCLDDSNFECAITNATNALSADTTNVEARRILASAYFGRSGLDFLDLAEGMLNLADSDDPNFGQIAAILPDDGSLDDLRLAITTLEALTDVDEADLSDEEAQEQTADAVFDLSLMQMVEHFAIGVYASAFKTGTMVVGGITAAQADNVEDDLLDFDNRMLATGVDSDTTFISEVRQTWCILEPLSAPDGFTVTEYQALVGCQLEPTTFNPVAIDAGVANCAALDPANVAQACLDADTAF
jgi:hypothetical protein